MTHENKNATLVSWSKLSREVRKFPAQNSAYKGIPEGWGQGLAGCHSKAASGETSGVPACVELLRQEGNLHAEQ